MVAKDLAVPALTVDKNNTLFAALRAMAEENRKELLVVDGNGKVVDVFTQADVNAVYERHIIDSVPEGDQPFARSVFQRWFDRMLGVQTHEPTQPPAATAASAEDPSKKPSSDDRPARS
ncbi:MAG TPA: hypothetical protein DFS52_14770 [Myxococcales bacterium]|nr:hypothetical protein [Myxococcales bacterium]